VEAGKVGRKQDKTKASPGRVGLSGELNITSPGLTTLRRGGEPRVVITGGTDGYEITYSADEKTGSPRFVTTKSSQVLGATIELNNHYWSCLICFERTDWCSAGWAVSKVRAVRS
jgi:hypothetical protein